MKTLARWLPVGLFSACVLACQVGRLLRPAGDGNGPPPDTTPARVAFATQPNNADVGAAITPPVSVIIMDSAGHPVTSYAGSVTVALGANATGATLAGANTATATDGVATFPGLSLDRPGTGYTLTAAASGLTGATSAPFDVTTRPVPPATQLAFTGQPATTEAGATITPAVQATVEDSAGATAVTYSGPVTVALGNNPGGSTLSGTTTAAASGGVATFSDLRLDQPGTGYTLSASASGLTGATSRTFDITAPPPPPPMAAALKFTSQPQSAESGASIGTITVAAVDSSGATVTAFSGAVTLAIGTNPGGGTLSGGTSAATSNGVATFAGLSIDKAGTGYTLTATTLGLAGATSAAFDIAAPPPTTGTLTVATVTTGSNLDPDGYTVTVDGATSQSIGANATATFSNLPAGSHTVVLGGIASNCSVGGGASQTVTVPAGGSTSASFAVTCQGSPPPTNQPPVVNAGGNQSALEGVLYQLNASFTDADGPGPWNYAVDWGDGTSSSGTLSAAGAIGPTHTYLAPGSYTITVTVTDAGGASGSDAKTLTVTL